MRALQLVQQLHSNVRYRSSVIVKSHENLVKAMIEKYDITNPQKLNEAARDVLRQVTDILEKNAPAELDAELKRKIVTALLSAYAFLSSVVADNDLSKTEDPQNMPKEEHPLRKIDAHDNARDLDCDTQTESVEERGETLYLIKPISTDTPAAINITKEKLLKAGISIDFAGVYRVDPTYRGGGR